MSLKKRMIQSMLEKQSAGMVTALNQKLGTSFTYSFDWACLPDAIDGWNWDDADLATCFQTSYFKPLEQTFSALFESNAMYREAITGQVKQVRVTPGRSSAVDFDLEGDVLLVKNTLSPNQLNGPGMYLESARKALEGVINSKLS